MAQRASERLREALASRILEWYASHRRDFPWRRSSDPYRVLIAEILLQRTRAEQVEPIYLRFVEAYPTPLSLASAETEDIERIIAPLGLRKRGAYLKRLAESIVADHGGRVPADENALLSLPGVGRYAANAVRCFAYEEDVPIVDWNIARLFGRLTGRPTRNAPHADSDFIDFVGSFVPRGKGREFNFALLDLSATVCTPRTPRCEACPVADLCAAFSERIGPRDEKNKDGGGTRDSRAI